MIVSRGLWCVAYLGLFMVTIQSAIAQDDLNFREDFFGSSLNPALRVLNPDSTRIALVSGEYLLLVTHPEKKNTIVYTKKLPENYEIQIRVYEPPLYQGQTVALWIGEINNNVTLGYSISDKCCDRHYFYLSKTLDEEYSELFERADEFKEKPFYLRLTKNGVEYMGEYSADGLSWHSLGKQIFIDIQSSLHVQVYNFDDAPETGVKIDSLEIKELAR